MSERPILFDTDIGSDVDDALALGVVLASPELELVSVTTVGAHSDVRARVAASLLGLAGRVDVEVCAGEAQPLLRRDRFNGFGHEPECVASGTEMATVSDEPAAERIVRAARDVDGLEIAAVGPMTNLARALSIDPDLPARVSRLWIMGGHIRQVRIGDFVCAPGIDYNLCSDPEATLAVLGAGFATTLVTADVTLSVWLERARLSQLRAAGPLATELARQIEIWEPVQRQIFTGLGGQVHADNVAFLHDPLTVFAMIDDTALHFEDLSIVPTIERGVLRTLEVAPDLGIGATMRVATAVDAPAAESQIAQRLLQL